MNERAFRSFCRRTKVQKEIWLAIQLGGDEANAAYNESVSINFDSIIDEKLIYQSLSELINRHESLRGTVSSDGNDLCIMDSIDLVLETHDLTDKKANIGQFVDEIIEHDIRKPLLCFLFYLINIVVWLSIRIISFAMAGLLVLY